MSSAVEAPVISILLPCWNAEASVGRALASALELRSTPIEAVVVDDGSTDRTAEIVAGIAAADERVRLIRLPENAGVSNARNRGLAEVRGRWLTLLDADDRFTPGGLERLARGALVGDAAPEAPLAVVGQQVWFDGRRTWIGPLYDIPDIREPGRKSLASHPGLLYYVSPHAKLFHRSLFEDLRFSGRVLGDQPWVIRALLRAGDRIDVLGDTVYEWYRPAASKGHGSITSRTRSSARLGVEAAGVAREALTSVTQEAEARLGEADRERVLGTYVERLLRSDLGVHLGGALGRGDPTIGELLDAIEDFVAATPAPLLADSDALAQDILEAPLKRWHRVNAAGRAAYGRLLATAVAADPNVVARTTSRRARLALRLALWAPAFLGPLAADVVLHVARIVSGVERRVRPASHWSRR
jgi:glycosyltransferase involved in cell wall biosynthesis